MLFNTIFNHGYFPKEWSLGEIIPLHKKGNINNVENYRGITLLSTLGKLFTSRLTRWAEDYSVSVEARAWFRETMSTTDHIFFSLHDLISHYLNKNIFCAFIDFSKTFDYVVRNNLWYKLIKLGSVCVCVCVCGGGGGRGGRGVESSIVSCQCVYVSKCKV